MKSKSNLLLLSSQLRTVSLGLVLAVLTILYGQGMGIVFGLNEDSIKGRLEASATEVRDSVYEGDEAAMQAVLSKSWTYMKRAHLHAGGMGTTALSLLILLGLISTSRVLNLAFGVALGGGGLGYSVFWMWAGFRAPALGSTGAAKESLAWFAMPTSGAFVLATIGMLILLVVTCCKTRK